MTHGSLHRAPRAKQTFAEGSPAAKRLKNTDVRACVPLEMYWRPMGRRALCVDVFSVDKFNMGTH